MAFLCSLTQKGVLRLEKAFMNFQKTSIQHEMKRNTEEQHEYERLWEEQGNEGSCTDSYQYRYYEKLDEQYEEEMDYIDAQIEAIEKMISSTQNSVKSGMDDSLKNSLS